METALDLQELLVVLQRIEAQAGRDRTRELRWGDRNLDLDILLVDEVIYRSENLLIPHPRVHERAFLLRIMVEMGLGNWQHPLLQQSLAQLLELISHN